MVSSGPFGVINETVDRIRDGLDDFRIRASPHCCGKYGELRPGEPVRPILPFPRVHRLKQVMGPARASVVRLFQLPGGERLSIE